MGRGGEGRIVVIAGTREGCEVGRGDASCLTENRNKREAAAERVVIALWCGTAADTPQEKISERQKEKKKKRVPS